MKIRFACLIISYLFIYSVSFITAQDARPNTTTVGSEGQALNQPFQTRLLTEAERSQYTATANAEQVESYLRRMASEWKEAELTTIGRTLEGRPIWALIVEPTVRRETKPLTVLMLGGIHAGECDGKEALMALARDMSHEKEDPWWNSLRLVFVPNFNADGNERRGRGHRPGQVGPQDGVGVRENAQGLDLNRDFIKLESPEVRGLVKAINDLEVDVLIDTHTTNGSLHQYDLTYDIPHNPNASKGVDTWLRLKLMPRITDRMEQAGIDTFYYGNFDAEHRRWETYGHEPRYSTEYMAMRGRIGILAESYSYATYERRIEASYAFVREVLLGFAEHSAEVRYLIDQASVAPHVGQQMGLNGRLARYTDGVKVKGFAAADGSPPKPPYGPESMKTNVAKEYSVQLWNRFEATEFAAVPWAYAVDAQYSWAISRLEKHGVRLRKLRTHSTLDVEEYSIESAKRGQQFQGHQLLELQVEVAPSKVTLDAGTYIIETSQPLGMLASYMLEPKADDGLAAWNFFDPDLESGQQFPALRVLQKVDAALLEDVNAVLPSEKITLEHLYMPGRSVSYGGSAVRAATWLKDRSEYVIRREDGAFAVDAATGAMRTMDEVRTLAKKLATLEAFSSQQAQSAASVNAFSDDWRHALIAHRRDLYYFESTSQAVRQLTHSPDLDEELAELSPDGKYVAFVRENNLWLVDTESTELKQLTKDGSKELLNGILDWVYQEELYGRGNFKAFWWSPDSRTIAFLQLDQTAVARYQVSDSTSIRQSLEETRYPKAGDPLPTARMWILDVQSRTLREIDLSSHPAEDRLVARVTWSPNNELWLQIFNRIQNQQSLVQVDRGTSVTTKLFTESTSGWIEVLGTPVFLPGGDFLWLSDLPAGRRHLYRVSATTGAKTPLTSGEWDVDSLVSVSADSATAFVLANISHPTELQLVAVDIEQATVRQVTNTPGIHRATVDASGKYFIDACSSLNAPPVTSLHTIDGQQLRVINATTSDRHEYVDVRPPLLTTIKSRDGVELQTQILLPRNHDVVNPEQRLPVLFYVYGGPQAPTVQNAWPGGSYWWHQMLCQQGFAVVLCDNRSARGRGIRDTWSVRGNLGRVELEDLEDAARWVAEQPWADQERFGIWGWSYGGYFTAYALTHSGLFKAGIAGAPVTDWRNYDAIYTERYMDLPKANPDGYKASSVVQAASNLSGRLLLIHGERDDNVHLSNTLQLAGALQNAGKQFELMIYPSNRHGITDPQQRFHMQRMMTEFLLRNLQSPGK
jgi:dipeptidyl-peptidase 4